MRWLLRKDVQILRRSPLLVALLVAYPVVIALMIGFALSSPPGKPKVAFYSEVPVGHGRISIGHQQIDVAQYAAQLYDSIDPIKVGSRDAAIAKVKDGEALAALVVPGDITAQIQSLVTTGVGTPTVELYLNNKDPLDRQFVQSAIDGRLNQVEQAVSKQVLGVATTDLQQVLNGGSIQFLGQSFPLLGLRNSRTILQGTVASLPPHSPLRAALHQVIAFADLAIQGLGFASPVLGSIGSPLTVQQTQLAGRTTPTDTYAAAIAVVFSLMFVTVLLAASMLALERSENAYSRLVRGLVTPGRLLWGKVVLAAGCAAAVALVMSLLLGLFVHLSWGRLPLWIAVLLVAAGAFGALGVAVGALAREVSVASLLGFAVALPVAFVALVPPSAVSGVLQTVLDAVSFVFPFRAALSGLSNAFSGAGPGIGLPLLHLAVLAGAFWAIARLALRRFAAR
jgi:ABC-type transport system involved in multi-copper enzyme maturation permease subunit